MMVVDLGDRTTKAVFLERRGELLALTSFVLLDTPIFKKNFHRIADRTFRGWSCAPRLLYTAQTGT